MPTKSGRLASAEWGAFGEARPLPGRLEVSGSIVSSCSRFRGGSPETHFGVLKALLHLYADALSSLHSV